MDFQARVNENGELAVIHRASGQFLDIEEGYSQYSYARFKNNNDKALINSVQKAYEICKNVTIMNLINPNLTKDYSECYKYISNSMLIHARNPRTAVLRASLLFDLRKNLTGKTLIVKQGQHLSI
jgi:hypothetical protein